MLDCTIQLLSIALRKQQKHHIDGFGQDCGISSAEGLSASSGYKKIRNKQTDTHAIKHAQKWTLFM